MEIPEQPLYHVTVVFRAGYGESFVDFNRALEFAELQMQRLLSEYEELEGEDFAGIYCEQDGARQYWQFDYEDGVARWMALEDTAADFDARVGGFRQGGTLVVASGPGPTDAANDG